MEPDDLATYGSTAPVTVWQVGDLAVKPHSGIVRIAGSKQQAGVELLVIEGVHLFASIENLTHIPAHAAAAHLVRIVDPLRAAELVARLRGPCTARVAGGPAARRIRCERALRHGELARHRLALHQLYVEPFRPSAEDQVLLAHLEAVVVGELAIALGLPFDQLRGELRGAHVRFQRDLLAPDPDGPAELVLRGPATLIGQNYDRDPTANRQAVKLRPGRWLVRDAGETRMIAHVEAEAALAEAVQLAVIEPRSGNVWLVDDAFADAPDVDDERFDPVDASLAGHGVHWYVIDASRAVARGVAERGELVLLAIEPRPEFEDDQDTQVD